MTLRNNLAGIFPARFQRVEKGDRRGRCPHRPFRKYYEFAGNRRKPQGFSAGAMWASPPTIWNRKLFLQSETPYLRTEFFR